MASLRGCRGSTVLEGPPTWDSRMTNEDVRCNFFEESRKEFLIPRSVGSWHVRNHRARAQAAGSGCLPLDEPRLTNFAGQTTFSPVPEPHTTFREK